VTEEPSEPMDLTTRQIGLDKLTPEQDT